MGPFFCDFLMYSQLTPSDPLYKTTVVLSYVFKNSSLFFCQYIWDLFCGNVCQGLYFKDQLKPSRYLFSSKRYLDVDERFWVIFGQL